MNRSKARKGRLPAQACLPRRDAKSGITVRETDEGETSRRPFNTEAETSDFNRLYQKFLWLSKLLALLNVFAAVLNQERVAAWGK
eukprot:3594698-Rhodomonas_salina.1